MMRNNMNEVSNLREKIDQKRKRKMGRMGRSREYSLMPCFRESQRIVASSGSRRKTQSLIPFSLTLISVVPARNWSI
jgi:hypothetical protein